MSIKSIKDETAAYELLVQLHSQHILFIELLITGRNDRIYKAVLYNKQISAEIQQIFGDVCVLFQCIKDGYEVDLERPALWVKAHFTIKDKNIVKRADIFLIEQPITLKQLVQRKLQSISDQINKLKHSKQKSLQNEQPVLIKNQSQMQQQNISHQHQQEPIKNYSEMELQMHDLEATLFSAKEDFENFCLQADQIYRSCWDIRGEDEKLMAINKEIMRQINQLGSIYMEQQREQIQRSQQQQMQKEKQPTTKKFPFETHQQSMIQIPEKTRNFLPKEHNKSKSEQNRLIEPVHLSNNRFFRIQGRKVTFIGTTNHHHQFVLNKQLKVGGCSSFRVKILHSQQSDMYIAVIPIAKVSKLKAKKSFEIIGYFGHDGEIWDDKPQLKQGQGFQQGDVIEMRIQNGFATWLITKNSTTSVINYKSQKIDNKGFYPVVQMATKGDAIMFLP